MCRHVRRYLATSMSSRATCAIVGALAISTIFCTAANAGTYLINNCNVPGRPAAALGPWYWEAAANLSPVDACASGGGFSFYLAGTVSMPRGAASALTMAAPPNGPISIRRVRLWVVGRLAGTGSALFVGTNAGAPDGHVTNSDLFGPPGGDTLATPHTTPLLPLGTNIFRVMLYCSQSSPDDCYPYGRSVLEIVGAEVMLLESVSPSVGALGGSLVSGDTQSGTRSLKYSAVDDQSGVEAVEVLIDGTVATRRDFGPECPHADYAACLKTRSEDLAIDTRTLTNGSHRLRLRVTDAAGNATDSPSQEIEVRNQPGAAGAGAGAGAATGSGESATAPPLHGGHVTASFAATSKRTLTASYSGRPKVTGRLRDADGRPVAKAPLTVVEKVAGQQVKITPIGLTGVDGKFAFRLKQRGGSRTVRVQYQSADGGKPLVSAPLRLKVRAAASLTVALSGIRVRYQGRVVSHGIPARGVVVQMQGRRRGGAWQPFASRRVRQSGRFAGSYRLRVRRPGVTLQFRAIVTEARGYPYERARQRL